MIDLVERLKDDQITNCAARMGRCEWALLWSSIAEFDGFSLEWILDRNPLSPVNTGDPRDVLSVAH